MTQSGIYYYKFKSGRYYIGKANDIERRWQEHKDSFLARKASKKVQGEYDREGLPEFFVLALCHQDHIDTLEAVYINRYWNQDILNTVRPQVAEEDYALEDSLELLKFPLVDIISTLKAKHHELEAANSSLALVSADLSALKSSPSQQTDFSLRQKVYSLTYDLMIETNKHDQTKEKLDNLLAKAEKPWYRKLF